MDSSQQAVLALAACFAPEDEARRFPQACWERLRTNLQHIVEQGESETWASFANLLVDFPGHVASVYHSPYPVHYFPTISALLLDAEWLNSLGAAALERARALVCRLLRLGKESAVAAEFVRQEPTAALQAFVLRLSPVQRLVLALVRMSPEAFQRLIPQASEAIVQTLETFVPLQMRVATLEAAESLRALISRYGSALPYIVREWSHPEFTRRLDEGSNRSLTLQLYASRERLGSELLPLLSTGIQARLACPFAEFHKSGLLIAAQLYDSLQSSLPERIECSLEEYLGQKAEPEADSDDASDYESDGDRTHYLSDLVGALNCEHKERVSRAITSAASLISEDLDELDVETPRLAEILLTAENVFNLPHFEDARLKALCALASLRPDATLPILRERLLAGGSRGKLLVLSVIDKTAESFSSDAVGPRVATKRADTAKTRHFYASKSQPARSSRFTQHHATFLQVVLDMFRKPAAEEVLAAGQMTLCRLLTLASHLRSQELIRALVFALRDCVRPGLQLSREVVTASLMLLDIVLRQFAAAAYWEQVLTGALEDYAMLREDLTAILSKLEKLQLQGLEQIVNELTAKLRILMFNDLLAK